MKILFLFSSETNRQPSKRRKRKNAAAGVNVSNASAGGPPLAGRMKRSPDPQNDNPVLGVCLSCDLMNVSCRLK